MSGVADEAGVIPRKVAIGLESEGMLAKDSVCGETRGSGDWVFRGKGSAVVAAAAGSEDDGAGESYIFFKLSNSELGVGREPGKAAGPTTDRATAKGCLVAGGVSGAGVQVSFILSSKTLLNHCNEVFLSTSRSSAVMEQPSSGGGGRVTWSPHCGGSN